MAHSVGQSTGPYMKVHSFTMRCEMKKFMGHGFCHPVFGGQWKFSGTKTILGQNEMCDRKNAPETSTVCPVGIYLLYSQGPVTIDPRMEGQLFTPVFLTLNCHFQSMSRQLTSEVFIPTYGLLDTLTDDFLGSLLGVSGTIKSLKEGFSNKELFTCVFCKRHPLKVMTTKTRYICYSWCHYFYHQLHQNNDTIFLMHSLFSFLCGSGCLLQIRNA
ncbi:uncharacterized protein LOC124977256 [Sciurus carolinensis]|uniref:uncharacterized protein LOC124977256 n=1 Tax=Sciurus carolinensis TaxID=30640 RepID=UPI001FB34C1F|nr:uncharacterized protein LOC124977256 [Sciurus carolinensis]